MIRSEISMFNQRPHKAVGRLLKTFDADVLNAAGCYLGGGTAIVAYLGEYRESIGIDFQCSSRDGFRLLRNAVTSCNLGRLQKGEVESPLEVRCGRNKISAQFSVDTIPIEVSFFLDRNIDFSGEMDKELGVPVLSRCDLYATKLMANADRGSNRSALGRDAIDLAMMIGSWGPIPTLAWDKAEQAYGESVVRGFARALDLIQDQSYLVSCLHRMKMDSRLAQLIPQILNNEYSFQLRKQGGSTPSEPT